MIVANHTDLLFSHLFTLKSNNVHVSLSSFSTYFCTTQKSVLASLKVMLTNHLKRFLFVQMITMHSFLFSNFALVVLCTLVSLRFPVSLNIGVCT